MKLIPDWRAAWRYYSTQALALQGAIAASWLAVPDDWRAAVPAEWLAVAALALTAFGVAGRFIDQTPERPE